MEVSGQFHAPTALPRGKEHRVPIEQESGWALKPFWTRWGEEKFPAINLKTEALECGCNFTGIASQASNLFIMLWRIMLPENGRRHFVYL